MMATVVIRKGLERGRSTVCIPEIPPNSSNDGPGPGAAASDPGVGPATSSEGSSTINYDDCYYKAY